jgi:hypothetical protein
MDVWVEKAVCSPYEPAFMGDSSRSIGKKLRRRRVTGWRKLKSALVPDGSCGGEVMEKRRSGCITEGSDGE